MLEFIDKIVIPLLASLYGSMGYLGVGIAMAIESAMVPLPSELILPFAGFLVSDPSKLEPLTHGPWSFWLVVLAGTLGNTAGSLISYGIGAWGGPVCIDRRQAGDRAELNAWELIRQPLGHGDQPVDPAPNVSRENAVPIAVLVHRKAVAAPGYLGELDTYRGRPHHGFHARALQAS